MTQTIPPPPQCAADAASRRRIAAPVRPRRGRSSRGRTRASTSRAGAPGPNGLDPLGRYVDASGRTREVIAGRRCDGCVLVVDRDGLTLGDLRLVALLGAEESVENAALVCDHYLRDGRRGRCRRVSAEDLIGRRHPGEEAREPRDPVCEIALVGRRAEACGDAVYRLELARTETAARELRWCRHLRRGEPAAPVLVCLRETVGALERYEPVCELTCRALRRYRDDASVSTTVLRGELERLRESPIVLNRKLREAVLVASERDGLSLSEIALRCERVKRDARGNASGDTSWLARRVGILPESGSSLPTPWVHSDVLALIAREGLGISPREVELG
jgi:hypothetical protein